MWKGLDVTPEVPEAGDTQQPLDVTPEAPKETPFSRSKIIGKIIHI